MCATRPRKIHRIFLGPILDLRTAFITDVAQNAATRVLVELPILA
jgi:hypothetical protein